MVLEPQGRHCPLRVQDTYRRAIGQIVGAHLLGYNADETINIFALAIKAGMKLADLQEVAWAYPTAAYDINRIR